MSGFEMLSAKGELGGWVKTLAEKIPLKYMKIDCRRPLIG